MSTHPTSLRRFGLTARAGALLATGLLLTGLATPAMAQRVTVVKSPQGITAWLVEEHTVPLLALRFSFTGGSAEEPDGKEGLSNALAAMLGEGAGDLDAAAFNALSAKLAARVGFTAGRDTFFGNFDTLTKHRDLAAELLRLALAKPRFDDAALERVRTRLSSELARAANDPRALATNNWFDLAFAGHSYARPVEGTREGLGRITADDLKGLHRRLFAKSTLKVVAVGDIEPVALGALLDRIFADLPEYPPRGVSEKLRLKAATKPRLVTRDYPASTMIFGLPGVPSMHPDFAAALVMNQVLGSGDLDSRLIGALRIERGLAYGVQTRFVNDSYASLLFGEVATSNENAGQALDVIRSTLRRFAETGPSPEELENAKSYLIGSFALSFDSNGTTADNLLSIWLDEHGPDYVETRSSRIEAVSLEDVKRVAKMVLAPEKLVVTIVGKPVGVQ